MKNIATLLHSIAELFMYISTLDEDFLRVHVDVLAREINNAREKAERLYAAWRSLSDRDRAETVASSLAWKQSKSGNGEYVSAAASPLLVSALKARGGRLVIGEYAYVLSRNGKWIQRYARNAKQGEEGKRGESK